MYDLSRSIYQLPVACLALNSTTVIMLPQGFIMSEAGSTKRSHMDQEFSNCSITAIHKQIKSVKNHRQRRKKTCIKHRLQKSNDLDFSICGDYKVEGAEECDCGMSYTTCSDPCCYAAHISPDDLSWNSTAVPCRTHRSPICINPFRFVPKVQNI